MTPSINEIVHSLIKTMITDLEIMIINLQVIRYNLLKKPHCSSLTIDSLARRELNTYHRIEILQDWKRHIANKL